MVKLLKRLRIVLRYDLDFEFVVWDYSNQAFKRFLKYEDARKFADEQFELQPKVMIGICR